MVQKKTRKENIQSQSQAIRVGIFGASGSGKTTKARELIRNCNRLVIFDALDDFTDIGRRMFQDLKTLERAIIKDFSNGFKFVFVPEFGKEVDQLSDLSQMLIRLQSGFQSGAHAAKITLVVDELDLSFPSGIRQRMPGHGFGFLCLRGRHYGINVIGVTQRPAQVDTWFRGNLSAMYIFRQSENIDLKNTLDMIGSKYKENLISLDNYEYIYKAGFDIKIKKNKKS